MKILIDTNIILDIALNRQPHVEHAASLFEFSKEKVTFYITPSSVTDIYYIAKKQLKHEKALEFILDLLEFCEMCPQTKNVFRKAAQSKFKDFEDAVQYFSADMAKVEAIITRNKKDYTESIVPVFSPEEFLKQL